MIPDTFTPCTLTLNAGSSSIKFAMFEQGTGDPARLMSGQVEGIGDAARLHAALTNGRVLAQGEPVAGANHPAAMAAIFACVHGAMPDVAIAAVGHRVVHGGAVFSEPVLVTDGVLDDLERLVSFAPLHQPHNLAGIRAARAAFPDAVQVAAFDTAFHRAHPFVNDVFALPRAYYEAGVRRYGFHGLSYEFITTALAAEAPELHAGRVIVAHLGNGASMCAIRGGRSIGSTMGFSALDGLPMGTRCGQLDPGVVLYLMESEGMDAPAIADLLYRRSGLLGLSGISHDMRTLEASDAPEAAEAIDYFVFRIRRELGALTAVLGGLDGLVFTGGIGEHSVLIRKKVCEGFEWLGMAVDEGANATNDRVISAAHSPVAVMVVPTDEERVIARAVEGLR